MWSPILVSKFLLPLLCWSSRERHWLVAWLVRRKGGGVVVAFVLVHLLARCHVVCAGRLARRDKPRHSLFLLMSGGIIPLTTGCMKVGVDRMHPDTCRRLLFKAASSRCVWELRHHTGEQYSAWKKASAVVAV